jgi:D-3-phosphoglycerate dehydrogenase
MPTVYVADPVEGLRPYAAERRVVAAAGADFIIGDQAPPCVRDAEVILVSSIPVTANVLRSLARCQLIVEYGIGFDNVDVETATACGIVVANAPTYCVSEVADHAAALILAFCRRILWLDTVRRESTWEAAGAELWGLRRLSTLTLGVIGLGHIGQQLVRRMAPFGVRIQGYDRNLTTDTIAARGAVPAAFDTVLRESDVVSLHVPLTPTTYHLIDEAALRLMKPTAVLVNTSRGAVVDEMALILALQQNRLCGAALDVLEREPPDPNNPLLQMDAGRVILTPHIAASSEESVPHLQHEVAAAVEAVLAGRWPRSVVNPTVVPKKPLRAAHDEGSDAPVPPAQSSLKTEGREMTVVESVEAGRPERRRRTFGAAR